MPEHQITIRYTEYAGMKDLPEEDQFLVRSALQAAQDAYAPYSKFRVGAALLLENGKIVTGNNQENAAYPSGLCAERVAIFFANANFPDIPVVKMAITAINGKNIYPGPIPPCGACRQVMTETEQRYKKPIQVLLAGGEKIFRFQASDLLPFQFTPDFIGQV